MRILYLSPSGALGGAERALLEVFRALRAGERSWTLGLITFEDGPLVAEARTCGVDTMVLPMPDALGRTGEHGRGAAGTLFELALGSAETLRYAQALRRRIAGWRPDIVHSNGIKAHVLAPWVKGSAALIWHLHDYLSARPVSGRLLRHSASAAALVLANSNSVAADVSGVLGPATRVETVYNAVDVSRYRPEGPRLDLDAAAGLAPATDVLRIGLVATFARWKGHGVFLRALAGLPDRSHVRAYVIGGPVYRTGDPSQTSREEILTLCRDLKLEGTVGLTGFLDDAAGAYRSLDIVVHASTSPEPFGLCIVEAMASGRAVVISDAGGAREIAEPGRTCLAHPAGDAGALRDALWRLVSDADLRARLSRAAAASVSARFSHRVLAQSLGALCRELAPCTV